MKKLYFLGIFFFCLSHLHAQFIDGVIHAKIDKNGNINFATYNDGNVASVHGPYRSIYTNIAIDHSMKIDPPVLYYSNSNFNPIETIIDGINTFPLNTITDSSDIGLTVLKTDSIYPTPDSSIIYPYYYYNSDIIDYYYTDSNFTGLMTKYVLGDPIITGEIYSSFSGIYLIQASIAKASNCITGIRHFYKLPDSLIRNRVDIRMIEGDNSRSLTLYRAQDAFTEADIRIIATLFDSTLLIEKSLEFPLKIYSDSIVGLGNELKLSKTNSHYYIKYGVLLEGHTYPDFNYIITKLDNDLNITDNIIFNSSEQAENYIQREKGVKTFYFKQDSTTIVKVVNNSNDTIRTIELPTANKVIQLSDSTFVAFEYTVDSTLIFGPNEYGLGFLFKKWNTTGQQIAEHYFVYPDALLYSNYNPTLDYFIDSSENVFIYALAEDNSGGSFTSYWHYILIFNLESSVITAVPDISLKNNSTVVFPNPADRQFIIRVKNLSNTDTWLRIYSLNGNQVFECRTSQNDYPVDASAWQSGMYIYTLSKDNQTIVSGKVVIR